MTEDIIIFSATYNFKISQVTLNVMKTGLLVNVAQIAFAYHTVLTVSNQKPAEFLNSCLVLFGVLTALLIGYRHGLGNMLTLTGQKSDLLRF